MIDPRKEVRTVAPVTVPILGALTRDHGGTRRADVLLSGGLSMIGRSIDDSVVSLTTTHKKLIERKYALMTSLPYNAVSGGTPGGINVHPSYPIARCNASSTS